MALKNIVAQIGPGGPIITNHGGTANPDTHSTKTFVNGQPILRNTDLIICPISGHSSVPNLIIATTTHRFDIDGNLAIAREDDLTTCGSALTNGWGVVKISS